MKHSSYSPIITVLLVFAMTLLPASLQAQWQGYHRPHLSTENEAEALSVITQMIDDAMATRLNPTKKLPIDSYLLTDEDIHYWTNGYYLFESEYDRDEGQVYFSPIRMATDDVNEQLFVRPININARTKVATMCDKPSVKVTVEQIGGQVMLVGRNAAGQPVFALQRVTSEMVNSNLWTLFFHHLFMGNYELVGAEERTASHAVFGPKMPFYAGDKYDVDPGFCEGYLYKPDENVVHVIYGAGRISRGDRSNPNCGKMPGGGGAAAIMGPMEWALAPTVAGLRATVIIDEPFVDHSPAIGKQGDSATLYCVQSPYDGLPGKWAFASVVPLTDVMLQWFPTEVLTLMRGEIYARHGDTFKNPDTQHYFDGQPWYQRARKGTPIVLSPLERFNYQFIKQVELSRATQN